MAGRLAVDVQYDRISDVRQEGLFSSLHGPLISLRSLKEMTA